MPRTVVLNGIVLSHVCTTHCLFGHSSQVVVCDFAEWLGINNIKLDALLLNESRSIIVFRLSKAIKVFSENCIFALLFSTIVCPPPTLPCSPPLSSCVICSGLLFFPPFQKTDQSERRRLCSRGYRNKRWFSKGKRWVCVHHTQPFSLSPPSPSLAPSVSYSCTHSTLMHVHTCALYCIQPLLYCGHPWDQMKCPE